MCPRLLAATIFSSTKLLIQGINSWRERWERLCVVVDDSASADQQRLRRTSNRLSFNPTGPGPNEYEAEQWRAGGGFRRGEVNVTRAGKFLIVN